ncbi:CNT_collapsed_G0047160.mRNA.1.CDS.1 [Saccharomyces cerevisiae]|nr:CNT_collapsed_G0047160.mRNA.1.CDS.1 [Saccharomyces cerevisiae]
MKLLSPLKRNKIGLKGLWHTPADQTGHGSPNVALRKQLDIYANVALFKSLKGVKTRNSRHRFDCH